MKSNIIKLGLFSIAASSLLFACKGGSSGGFDTDATTGVQYRFIKHDENGKKPAIGDFAHVVLMYKNDKDSIMFDTRKRGDSSGAIKIALNKGFSGCLEQGITLMAAGDSAQFKINTDSLYLKTFRMKQLPPGTKTGTMLTFYVKLLGFQTKQEMDQQRQQEMMKRQIEAQKRQGEEWPAINDYLTSHHITVKPTKDSIYFLQHTAGKGKAIHDGDSLEVKYKGTLLDGSVFDQSDKGPGHTSISFVYSKNMHMIQGWIIVLGGMHEGEKAQFLLPSKLAYGPQSPSPMIPPFSPLIFELEIVKVMPNKK